MTAGIGKYKINTIIPKTPQNTRPHDYSFSIQTARMDSGFTQFQLGELTGKSAATIKAYEAGTTKPPPYMLKRIADVCNAPELYSQYINHDEIISEIIPPIVTGTKEKTAMRFELARKQLNTIADEILSIADNGAPSQEYYTLLGNLVSAGMALKLNRTK